MRYSITLASFRTIEPIEETLAKVAKQGFDAVEMYGEPQEVDIVKLHDILNSYSIPICGITGMWGSISKNGWKRKLLSTDSAIVKASEQYVHDCVKMCSTLGGNEMNLCLFTDNLEGFDKTHSTIDSKEKDQVLSRAVPLMKKLCAIAANYGVELVIEPLNRYSTPYCATAKDAISIVQQVDSLGILLDTFHMNIEEDSFEEAIRSSSKYLRHTHFAENNRKMPGSAHTDFETIVRCLVEVGYDGFASFEPNIPNKNYDHEIRTGLEFVKKLI